MAICELIEASKTYGSGVAVVNALDRVSVAIEPGEFTVFSGPSGSGKTTLLNMVGLLDTATSGSVRIEGQEVMRMSARALAQTRARRIGFIFQSFNLVPVLSAAENVETALFLAGIGGDRRKQAVEALASVGLGELVNRRPTELSGGQCQRVAVARALVKRPALIIADEPTANLDSKTGSQLLELMRKMNDELGITFIFSTHDPMVMARARRILTLHDGRLEGDERREAPASAGKGA